MARICKSIKSIYGYPHREHRSKKARKNGGGKQQRALNIDYKRRKEKLYLESLKDL